METIHKKNGRLHIYVRQDKYKGELKSHNWVGRTYINGKQKVISSGTTNLEEAIPILEKWFDDLQVKKGENNDENKEISPENLNQPDLSSKPGIFSAPCSLELYAEIFEQENALIKLYEIKIKLSL